MFGICFSGPDEDHSEDASCGPN